ncbi:hypothetical protein [Elizabethkingia sp. JS20170427COW]|uniref:hypothetical protein n=1 Tax=Elizabethkingia sp. JS20170427COW TaxID=2583851 RepID=UPI0011100CD4|nr:hypothetical protein [Elizabethkingia sp. JS20170427COW]QCX53383.1 hypothetical protein FGE20_06350 [Elizabethkingia sp. JS20170427COW]
MKKTLFLSIAAMLAFYQTQAQQKIYFNSEHAIVKKEKQATQLQKRTGINLNKLQSLKKQLTHSQTNFATKNNNSTLPADFSLDAQLWGQLNNEDTKGLDLFQIDTDYDQLTTAIKFL